MPEDPRSVKIQMPEPAESRSGEEAMPPQSLVSVDRDPKNPAHTSIKVPLYVISSTEGY